MEIKIIRDIARAIARDTVVVKKEIFETVVEIKTSQTKKIPLVEIQK